VTVNVCPAMVSVPVREAPMFATTLNPAVPLPVPVAPDVTRSHGTLLLAVHAHALVVVTVTVPVPPVAGTFWLVGLIEYVHGATNAAWLTVNVWPAMVAVPVRAAPVLAATLISTEPFPVPDAPDVTVIHGTPLAAVHAHAAVVVTATVAVFAAALTF
jgi:hypothetical protein